MSTPRRILYALLALAVLGAFKATYNAGWNAREVEILAESSRRVNDANRADGDAGECARDPECRLRSDKYERR